MVDIAFQEFDAVAECWMQHTGLVVVVAAWMRLCIWCPYGQRSRQEPICYHIQDRSEERLHQRRPGIENTKHPDGEKNHTYVTTDEFDHQICLSFSKAPDCVYCALKNKPGFQTNPNCDMISLTWTSKSIVVIISHLCLFAFRAYNEE